MRMNRSQAVVSWGGSRWGPWAAAAFLAASTTIYWDSYRDPTDVAVEWLHVRPIYEPCDRDQDGVIDPDPCVTEYEELGWGLERAYWPDNQLPLPHDALGPQDILYYEMRATWGWCP